MTTLLKGGAMKKTILFVILIFVVASIALAQTGVKKKRPLPYEYGKVIINNSSESAHLAPVVFDHWFHRSQFTCRLCHVDLAFAMKAGGTNIKAEDNVKGYYCGTCHNGKKAFANRTVFAACSKEFGHKDLQRCERCHSLGKNIKKEHDFAAFSADMPKERFGNGIDWEKAESLGLVKPVDFLEGISIKRPKLKIQKDFNLDPKVEGMPKIVFSHKKHTVWNGCEVCHPEIFAGIKKGTTKYAMVEIMQGKYCGACHGSVAFPLIDCQRCHSEPVQ
jgi:c(7)-type cytochrome triheme protein